MRPGRGRHRDPAVRRGGLRCAAGVHRAGDPAHQPRQRDPADDQPRAGRRRGVPVRGAAGQAQRVGRRTAAGGARRAGRRRRPADQGREAAGAAADRPAARPDDPRGRAARLRARGAGDRRRAVAAGPARAAGGDAPAGRPAARPLQGRELRLPDLAQPVALREGAAEGAQQQRVPPDVQAGVPQLPARPRVAGLRVPAPPGLQGDEDRDRPSGRRARRGRHPPGAAERPALPHRRAGGAGEGAGPRGPQADARVPRRTGREVRDLPGQRAEGEEPAVRDGRRAGRDRPTVGAPERRDQARVGRATRPATSRSAPTPSRTGPRSAPP